MALNCPQCQSVLAAPLDFNVGVTDFLCTQCHTMLTLSTMLSVAGTRSQSLPQSMSPATIRVVAVFQGQASLEIVQEILEPTGFEIATAGTGRAALSLIDQFKPSIAIIDDELPDLTGLDLCELLKRSKRHPGLQVLRVMKSSTAQLNREINVLYGPDDYMIRSALYESLKTRVTSMVRQATHGVNESHSEESFGADPDATRLMHEPWGSDQF